MKNLKLGAITFVSVLLFLYLAFSFVVLDFNITKWSEFTRFAFAVFGIAGAGIISGIVIQEYGE